MQWQIQLLLVVLLNGLLLHAKDLQECELVKDGYHVCREIESFDQLNQYVKNGWQSVKIVNEHTGIEITHKPMPNLAKLIKLDLSESGGLTLGKQGFRQFELLQELNITHCQLEELKEQHFSNMRNLLSMDVSYNDVQLIGEQLMSQLPNLIYANFSNNLIAEIEPNAFKSLKKLIFLDLTTNEQDNVTIGENANLRYLSISNNNVRDFHWCRLRGLPKLEELHLHSNWLEVLDVGIFYHLPKLRVFNVSNNNIYDIKPNLFMGPSEVAITPLELLDYSSNNVKLLDDNVFYRLNNLRTLNLWFNQINKISAKAFQGLTKLESLHLQGNKITALPDHVFANLTSLEILDLSRNALRQLNRETFGNGLLGKLWMLDLSNNNLEQLHPLALSSLPFLRELRLRRNKLTTLDIRMFAPLRRLQLLTLSENRLEEIDIDILDSFDRLTALEINNNKLTYLPVLKSSNYLAQLQQISIEGNPWQCLCLDEITAWLDTRQVRYARPSSAYYSGRKPLCVVTPMEQCIRDLNSVRAQGIVESYEQI